MCREKNLFLLPNIVVFPVRGLSGASDYLVHYRTTHVLYCSSSSFAFGVPVGIAACACTTIAIVEIDG